MGESEYPFNVLWKHCPYPFPNFSPPLRNQRLISEKNLKAGLELLPGNTISSSVWKLQKEIDKGLGTFGSAWEILINVPEQCEAVQEDTCAIASVKDSAH